MVQIIEQADRFGKIGKAFGEGIAEQLPKEMDRYRLAKGLEKLNAQKDLSPREYYSKALTLPGLTEQGRQSLGELAKTESQAKALEDIGKKRTEAKETESPFPKPETFTQPGATRENAPSVSTRAPIEATLKPRIPKTYNELLERASELFQGNKAFYKNDPQLALQAAQQEDQQAQSVNTALQAQRTNETDVQNTIKKGLQSEHDRLGAVVPGRLYSSIEDKAINAVKSIADGGEGLTEQEAQKKYGKELDEASRDYSTLNALGNWSILTRSPAENKRSIKEMQKSFKERNDLQNFSDELVARNKLSPGKASLLAHPVKDIPNLNKELKNIPKQKMIVQARGMGGAGLIPTESEEQIQKKTLAYSEKLLPLLGSEGSPLAVAEHLKSKGYDPDVWMNYVGNNQTNLNQWQIDEIKKPRNFTPTLNDMWMFSFSNLDDLGE